MNYIYVSFEVTPEKFDTEVNKLSVKGWTIFHIQPINKMIGINLDRTPKIEFLYHVVMQRLDNDKKLN